MNRTLAIFASLAVLPLASFASTAAYAPAPAQAAASGIKCTNMGFSGRGRVDNGALAVSARCPGAGKTRFKVTAGGRTSPWTKGSKLSSSSWSANFSDPALVQGSRTRISITVEACKSGKCRKTAMTCNLGQCGQLRYP